MYAEEALEIVGRLLPPGSLNAVKTLVLREAWEGKGYAEIAGRSGYDHDYVRKAGSQLWQALSEALGTEVTKKNFRLLLEHYVPRGVMRADETPLFPGGPVPLGSSFYVEPPSLSRACAEIEKSGCLLRIKAPRKMGKSSFLLRLLGHAEEQGYAVASLDFLQIDEASMRDIDRLLRWMAASISHALGIEPDLDRHWNEDLGSKVSCAHFLERHLLELVDTPVVLTLNEIGRVFEYPEVARELLPFLRSCYEEARHRPTFARLRWVLAYSTEVYVPIDVHQSPFNVGLPIELPELEIAEIYQLARAYGLGWERQPETRDFAPRLTEQISGHPFLVQLALYSLATAETRNRPGRPWGFKELLEEAPTPAGIYGAHLQSYLAVLQARPELGHAFRKVLEEGATRLDPIQSYHLESLGLVRLVGSRVVPSCALYRRYFADYGL